MLKRIFVIICSNSPSILNNPLSCWTGVSHKSFAFSTDLLEWGRKFSDFWGKQGFKMGRFSVKKSESCCLLNLTISSHWPHYIPPLETTLIRSGCINRKWLSWDRENYIFQKVTKMGSIIGQKVDYNGVGALRGQRHIPTQKMGLYPGRGL